ncbi:hypothetical protein ABPG75_004151 [Micractinium tetrahymenae]
MQQAPPPAGPPSAGPPSLSEAPQRRPWLLRSAQGDAGFDQVLLVGEAGPVAGSRVSLHSLASSTAASIVFDNQSSLTVRCLWMDWEGNEVPYSVLKPGESSCYSTWKSHAWVVRELEGARRMCLNGAQAIVAAPGKQTAAITDAPALAWREDTHRAFSRDFQAAARTLLLCWQRLGVEGGRSSPRGGAAVANLGSLPFDVVSAGGAGCSCCQLVCCIITQVGCIQQMDLMGGSMHQAGRKVSHCLALQSPAGAPAGSTAGARGALAGRPRSCPPRRAASARAQQARLPQAVQGHGGAVQRPPATAGAHAGG